MTDLVGSRQGFLLRGGQKMQKYIFIVLFVILNSGFIFAAESSYQCGRITEYSYNNQETCLVPTDVYFKFYDTAAEALAAKNAEKQAGGCWSQDGSTPNAPNFSGGLVNYNIWSTTAYYWNRYNTCCPNPDKEIHLYLYKQAGWIDNNNDCIFDEESSEDCANQYYHINVDVRDSSNNLLYAETVNSLGGKQNYGDPSKIGECLRKEIGDCTVNYYNAVNINPETGEGDWNPGQNLCDVSDELGLPESQEGEITNTETQPSGEKGTQGQAGDVNDTQAQALDKIADNTMETANNTDGLQDTANGIESQLKLANDKLEKIANKSQENDTPTNESKGKVDQLDGIVSDNEGDAGDYSYTQDDVDEPTAIGTILENIKDNNPITAFLSKVSITSADPACAINGEITFMSQPIEIEFSLCEWEVWIDFMGMIIYMLAVIYFIMLIFG